MRYLDDPKLPMDNNECEQLMKTIAPQWGRKDRLFDRRFSDKDRNFRSFASVSLARSIGSRRNYMSETAQRQSPRYQLAA
jgi:hypothetical protein